jgi:hypothetical protein
VYLVDRKNATHLFEFPGSAHNSESWWSALFSTLLLYVAKHPEDGPIPLKRFVTNGTSWTFESDGNLQPPQGLRFEEVLTEPRLSQRVFGVAEWQNVFTDLRPDVVGISARSRKVILVENKTVGAYLGPNAEQLITYLGLAEHLQSHSWEAECLLLISVGYEGNQEWKVIRDRKVRLILWEDILRLMDKIDRFRELFSGVNLSIYYNAEQSGIGWRA